MMTTSLETFSASLALCERNPPVTGGFPSQRPVTWNFDVSFDMHVKNTWANNLYAGDLILHRAHYDVSVICVALVVHKGIQIKKMHVHVRKVMFKLFKLKRPFKPVFRSVVHTYIRCPSEMYCRCGERRMYVCTTIWTSLYEHAHAFFLWCSVHPIPTRPPPEIYHNDVMWASRRLRSTVC